MKQKTYSNYGVGFLFSGISVLVFDYRGVVDKKRDEQMPIPLCAFICRMPLLETECYFTFYTK
ncbi:hypothetical protein [Flavobacterium suncheonense]|uniref:hypothetical protein n=1 Tax=Flavobacterium suncheonense TaxID=350894 RepID=UPI003FA39085